MPVRRVGGWLLAVINRGCGAEEESRVVTVLRRVYERVGGGGYAELHLYPSRWEMEAALLEEARERGVRVDAVFPVMHEAWTGLPRIHVAPSELEGLGEAGEAFLVHEAFHSVLHGSLEYYMVSLPPASSDEEWVAAYIAATSLKDLEVHMEMKKHGFRRELLAEKRYWETTLGERWLCETIEDVGDVLRAATIWLVLGMSPPLATTCRERVAPLINLFRNLIRQHTRPWSQLDKAIRITQKMLAL